MTHEYIAHSGCLRSNILAHCTPRRGYMSRVERLSVQTRESLAVHPLTSAEGGLRSRCAYGVTLPASPSCTIDRLSPWHAIDKKVKSLCGV